MKQITLQHKIAGTLGFLAGAAFIGKSLLIGLGLITLALTIYLVKRLLSKRRSGKKE